jgi:hypothetical protein
MAVADTALAKSRIVLSVDQLAEFCRRWKIVELAVFGSVLGPEFRPDSDVDMLVTFAVDAQWSLLDHVRMQDELSDLLKRDVDLVSRKGIEKSRNYVRRKAILESSEVIYAAA